MIVGARDISHAYNGGDKDHSWLAQVNRVWEILAHKSDKLEELRGADLTKLVQCIIDPPGSFHKLFRKLLMDPEIRCPETFWPKFHSTVAHQDPSQDLQL